MAENTSPPERPLDALRRATFAAMVHAETLRDGDGAAAGRSPSAVGETLPPPRPSLKPKRKVTKR